jgi:hypothetical protein
VVAPSRVVSATPRPGAEAATSSRGRKLTKAAPQVGIDTAAANAWAAESAPSMARCISPGSPLLSAGWRKPARGLQVH